jgi:autotransporter-associated beta strand protein
LTKVGPGSATVNFAANNFSGPTIVSNGVLNISGGGAIGDTSAVTLKDVAGVSLVINNSEIIGSLAGGGATGGNVSLSGTLTAGGNNATTTYAGAISGSGSLTKVGTGALSLGGSNSVSGNVTVNNGALNLAGSGSLNSIRLFVGAGGTTGTVAMVTGTTLTNNYSAPGSWWADYALALGVDNNGLGTLNMSGGTLNLTGNVWVSCWGGTGNWNQTGGTANISGNFWVGGMQDNDSAQPNGSIGTAIISNATLSAGNVRVGRGGVDNGGTQAVATSRVKGDMTVANGGVVNSENDLQVGYSGSGSSGWGSYGTLNIENGGIVNVASTTERWMTVGRYNSIDATVNIKSGGTLNLNAATDLQINEGDNTGIRVVNVEGLLQGTAAGGSYIDLNRNATADGTTTFNITNGGVVAVDAIVGKANCTLNFDNGTLKATADDANFIGAGFTANILTGGVTLNTDGHNPTVPGILLNNGVDEDGGLTKTGNGTLYLNGANTYTNVTTVNAGLLGGTGTIAGRVVVNSGAGLAPGNSIGALTINGNITLNASSTNVFEVDGTTPANDQVVAGANVTYGGVLKIVPTGTFTNGQEFVLFSGAGAANASNFASINSGSPSLVLSFTNGVLTVVSSMAAYSTNITAVVNGSNLEITWPSTHQGWMIEAQTNTIAVGLLTNGWVTISNTASVTGFTNTLNSENGAVFYRLRKP